jgi:hypothetical protein
MLHALGTRDHWIINKDATNISAVNKKITAIDSHFILDRLFCNCSLDGVLCCCICIVFTITLRDKAPEIPQQRPPIVIMRIETGREPPNENDKNHNPRPTIPKYRGRIMSFRALRFLSCSSELLVGFIGPSSIFIPHGRIPYCASSSVNQGLIHVKNGSQPMAGGILHFQKNTASICSFSLSVF